MTKPNRPGGFRKGDRVVFLATGELGVVAKGGACVRAVLDGARHEASGPAEAFASSAAPLPSDPPSPMDRYAVTTFRPGPVIDEPGMFTAVITRDGVPIIEAANAGDGGANRYRAVPGTGRGAVDEFTADAAGWAEHFGAPGAFEADALWIEWWQGLRPFGVTSREHLAGLTPPEPEPARYVFRRTPETAGGLLGHVYRDRVRVLEVARRPTDGRPGVRPVGWGEVWPDTLERFASHAEESEPARAARAAGAEAVAAWLDAEMRPPAPATLPPAPAPAPERFCLEPAGAECRLRDALTGRVVIVRADAAVEVARAVRELFAEPG